jgi:anti-anti-sigma factor
MNENGPHFAQVSVRDGITIITITTDQIREANQAYGLRDEILAILKVSNPSSLVLDLGKLTFVGSIGFLAFLGVKRHLAGGRIVICNMSGPVHDMFAVCQLISSDPAKQAPFEAAETLDAAVAKLSA